MVKSFNFARLPEIYFGCGKLTELPPVVNLFGKRIILVTGNNSFMSSVKGAELLDRFRNVNISFSHVSIKGEPSPEIINETVADLSAERYDAVVAIGGGSVVDAGKAISAMMYRKESVIDFLEVVGHKVHPGTKLPFIAVPTTSGTGSEATKNAVISRIDPAGGFKRSLRHDNFVPDFAIVDPMLTVSCTRPVTAASGMDCFTQLTESFLSVKSNPFTDSLLIEGLKKLKSSLRVVCSDGGNIEARTGMSFAALTSGICLANAGLGAVHGFASSLGGMYNMPHGLICGSLMAVANKINVRELRRTSSNPDALKKYAVLGRLFIDKESKSNDFYIDGFISYLEELTDEFMLPGLGCYGLREKDIGFICSNTDIKNNPVRLTDDHLAEILLCRI